MTRLLEGGEIAQRLLAAVPNSVNNWDETQVWVSPECILEVCRFLKDTPDLELDLPTLTETPQHHRLTRSELLHD